MAIAEVDMEENSGVMNSHSSPAFVVFQMPPPTVATNQVFPEVSVGSTAILRPLPLTFPGPRDFQGSDLVFIALLTLNCMAFSSSICL